LPEGRGFQFGARPLVQFRRHRLDSSNFRVCYGRPSDMTSGKG
jgi:hypothetical protein